MHELQKRKRVVPYLVLVVCLAVCTVNSSLGIAQSNGTAQQEARQRLTPREIKALPQLGAGAGTSGVAGIQTRLLKGDPTKPGLYTIELKIPAHTTIQAHTHPDDRTATVISGTWYLGYGNRFNAKDLKPLPPGSFYTEPPSELHFARTGDATVVLHISGLGPTGTHYTE